MKDIQKKKEWVVKVWIKMEILIIKIMQICVIRNR